MQKLYLKFLLLSLITFATIKWFLYVETLPSEFEISGKIDQCCCDAELIKDVNRKIVDVTDKVAETTFFRIFRVNLNNDCPFWAQELLCKNPGQCTVCHCDENEVPLPWRFTKTSRVSTINQEFATWETQNKKKRIEWHVEDIENDEGIYVDLKKNPEKFTGYQGQRIWNTIYSENCFTGSIEEMCHEERLLYRLVSGLHTSISTQLTEYYGEKNKTKPNDSLFFEKVGNYPDRMSNLYFAYSVLLRAINRAQHHIQNYTYETGDFKSDIETKRYIDQLYDITTKNCDHPFDESELFSDITKVEVKEKFITYFHNISRTLDCVECEVCKVYSKLQTYGIAAALKILFSEKLEGEKEISLKRNELIALVNTFNKFSTSINYIDKMFERKKKRYWNITQDVSIVAIFFIVAVMILNKMYKSKTEKISKDLSKEFSKLKEQ